MYLVEAEDNLHTLMSSAVLAASIFIFGSSNSSVWTEASCPKNPALSWFDRAYLKRQKGRVVKFLSAQPALLNRLV